MESIKGQLSEEIIEQIADRVIEKLVERMKKTPEEEAQELEHIVNVMLESIKKSF